MEDRFAMLQIQVDSLAGGAAECPCVSGRCPRKCNTVPLREPPKRRATPEDDREIVKKDHWDKYPRRGGGDDDGGGGGDGGW